MRAVLLSCYELGRQPFGLASPAAWMARAGADVRCLDLAIEKLDERAIRGADLIAFHLPMHTATRIAVQAARRVRDLNPSAHLCFYGLYAPLNEGLLRGLGASSVLGGEFESGLASIVTALSDGIAPESVEKVSLERQRFLVPSRAGLPPLDRYAAVHMPDGSARITGYTEATRGCKHLCRHCPIVPVYNGAFRVVQADVVVEDIARLVEAGAEHVTFGDPDFLNAPTHSMRVIARMREHHPDLTFDATIKVEHLLRHRDLLADLSRSGCLFVTTAVESINDDTLAMLDKGHTRRDVELVVDLAGEAGLALNPTFVPFNPWEGIEDYLSLLDFIEEMGLVENTAPVQLGLRLLIPAGSRLLDMASVRSLAGGFDAAALVHPWKHADPDMDELQREVMALVAEAGPEGNRPEVRSRTFDQVSRLAGRRVSDAPRIDRAAVPYLTEPWYC